MRLLVHKDQGNRLAPASPDAATVLRALKPGECVWISLARARHPKFHRLYFAACREIFDNQEITQDWQLFQEQVKILAGHFDMKPLLVEGETVNVPIPRSIDFDSMDDTAFHQYVQRAIPAALEYYCPGADMDGFRERVREQIRERW